MKRFEYVITDELGIHTRPAGALNKKVKKYDCKVLLKKGEKEVDVSQLIQLMLLGVNQGDKVEVIFDGKEEEAALEDVKLFFETNL